MKLFEPKEKETINPSNVYKMTDISKAFSETQNKTFYFSIQPNLTSS